MIGGGAHLADEEDEHDAHQHDGDVVLARLSHVHAATLALRASDGRHEARVEDGEDEQRHDAHDGHVEPGEVDLRGEVRGT